MMGLEIILGGVVAAILAVIGSFFAGRIKGKAAERMQQEAKRNEDYREARERVDEAVRRSDGDTRPLDDRLREHGAFRE